MGFKTWSIVLTFLTAVSSRSLHEARPSEEFGSKEQFPENIASPLQRTIVLQMHYDCQGRLIRQEASKMNIITGLFLIPEEENILLNTYKNSEPFSTVPGGYNNINIIYDEERHSDTHSEAPLFFRSKKERVRPIPKTLETQPVEENTSLNIPENPTTKPQVTQKPKLIFDPDRIIDVPVRSCPSGENEDVTKRCRPVFPEN